LRNRIEILSMDKRIEPIDDSYRGLPDIPDEFLDYTVTGNQPVIIRESLLPEVLKMGTNTVKASMELFHPGMIGPFCLETIYHPKRGFTVFEISARIVAGTNLYPEGSPYSAYIFNEPMSTGRRIAREINLGIENGKLEKIVF
jgi:5-formaminoimidazole-4-carboxamide-1-(beta)-D-ribofuranosyl 5'-monophosphate synthetase